MIFFIIIFSIVLVIYIIVRIRMITTPKRKDEPFEWFNTKFYRPKRHKNQ